ncbi:MAG TPA: tetratricopeptide repeat protein [Terracidiphilus sp.]|jgi:Flp pilus assembly protein TadD|nr:tetratricopeptide repeat protein [Terracidiphilus sp.]
MSRISITLAAILALMAMGGWQQASARDGHRLMIPLRSRLSPVQRLNREGVEAVKKHQYDRAETLFYRAYLYDSADPFTLNNLGYISEVQGELDRAQKFYALAAEQGSDANIDVSSARHLKGQPMKAALVDLKDRTMRVNRMNIDAMRLLQQERGFEAVVMLQQALALDPGNAFTLNNLGVASESLSDLDGALRYYQQAAALHSSEPAAITLDRSWRGKSVSSIARESARRLEKKLQSIDPAEAKAVMFTLRGVHAENQNDWASARQDFLHAYALDPSSAFSLNNRGYVAEREGDLETAQYFYGKSRRATDSTAVVGLATRLYAQGKPLIVVAADSDQKVDSALEIYSQQRKRQQAPVELTPRDNSTPVTQPDTTPNQPQSPQ